MSEWFDARTSRWHVRVADSERVLISEPVRRIDSCGAPLRAEVFNRLKADTLQALKEQGTSLAGKSSE